MLLKKITLHKNQYKLKENFRKQKKSNSYRIGFLLKLFKKTNYI